METVIDTSLTARFTQLFGGAPTAIIRSPGRVNLIGEHTDYNGFPVLPISIPFAINAAVSPREDAIVQIDNVDASHKPLMYDLDQDIIPSKMGDWSNYVKAASYSLTTLRDFRLKGMNALFQGSIPESAGLSSSSALITAATLAHLWTNDIHMGSIELAELMAQGEKFVGTCGGGMDQAICLLGKEGFAVKLDFSPLRYAYVPFPENCTIIVANSLVKAQKTGNARLEYNHRTIECRCAVAFINALYNPLSPLALLGDLPDHDFFTDCNDHESFVRDTFPQDSYTLADIARIMGEIPAFMKKNFLEATDGTLLMSSDSEFLLRQRVMHVLSEAHRVEIGAEALARGDAESFGALMNESHLSCSEMYGISTPEINTLVSVMRDSGALGARITGAGFGGCAVAIVHDEDCQKVIEVVQNLYYNSYLIDYRPDLLEHSMGRADIFLVKPSDGAIIENMGER